VRSFENKEQSHFVLSHQNQLLCVGRKLGIFSLDLEKSECTKVTELFCPADLIMKEKDRFIKFMKFHSNFLWVAVGRYLFRLHPTTLQQIDYFDGHTGAVLTIHGVGNDIWTSALDGTIIIRDALTGAVIQRVDIESKTFTMITVGQHVWTAGWDKFIRVWDPMKYTHRKLQEKHKDVISSLIQVWDTTVWSVSWDTTICIWT